ncbi:MAG TPA: SprT family zinc-dependent metalloprotease [Stellaceae bacterium]|nr:SprT family zinc-dependent metalloprotease [Stellaceae bacterium]
MTHSREVLRLDIGAADLGAAVRLRVSARARRLALRVDAAAREVELVLPRGVSRARGLAFLAERRGWVLARLRALPEHVPFAEGAVVPVLGVPHKIVVETDASAPPVAIANREIRVRGDPAHLARRVRDHLGQVARAEFIGRARLLAAAIGRKVAHVGVRDGKSRWGSCSSQGNLCFSWRLILAPESVLAYVVAHEVAHLAEMNHGRRFWQIVERLSPRSAEARAWLRRNRSTLLCYG